jgi:hypothetical protein
VVNSGEKWENTKNPLFFFKNDTSLLYPKRLKAFSGVRANTTPK